MIFGFYIILTLSFPFYCTCIRTECRRSELCCHSKLNKKPRQLRNSKWSGIDSGHYGLGNFRLSQLVSFILEKAWSQQTPHGVVRNESFVIIVVLQTQPSLSKYTKTAPITNSFSTKTWSGVSVWKVYQHLQLHRIRPICK